MAEQVYLHQLVEFVEERTKDGQKSIDCIPTKWIEFDMVVGQCFAKFMPPPYTKESAKFMKEMVVENIDAVNDWPRYPITIRGHAGSVTVQPISESFEQKFEVQFPFETHEKFQEFDTKLLENKQCRIAFVQLLSRKFDDKKSMTKNITAALKRCFTRDVALMFDAQKKMDGKFLFKDTTFSACFLDVIDGKAENQLILPISDSDYLTHLGAVLSNVKDWGVARSRRVLPKNVLDE